MKRINMFLAGMAMLSAMFTSCSYTTADLANDVKASITTTFRENDVEGVVVKDVILVHEGGNHYSGIVTTVTDGEVEKFDIAVVCDGENFKWEIPELLDATNLEDLGEAFEEAVKELEEAFEDD
jgi:hypothetical protein